MKQDGMQTSVRVGYLLNTQKSKVAGVKSSDSYSGFMAAADYNVNLTGDLSVAPGLGLGYSFDNSNGTKYKELGLFAPIDFNYRFPVGDALSLSVFAGPTLYYGLIAKNTSTDPSYNYYDNDNSKIDGITEKNNCLYLSVGYLF